MIDTVLFVDDEPNILFAVERLFIDSGLELLKAASGEEAIAMLPERDVAVLVSDNMMPGMRGVDLLARTRAISPDTVRIMMTGHADLPTAIDAINRGEVFRFIVKPWNDDELLATIEEALNRFRMVRTLRKADEATLRSLAQTIELKDPYTRGHCDRVAAYAILIGERLGLPDDMLRDLKHGSWLHDCGKIGVPEAILNFPGPLDKEMFDVIKKHPTWGADVARQAELSPRVVNIILYHHERVDGKGYPGGVPGSALPLEGRIVAAADIYDAITTDRPYKKGATRRKAMEILAEIRGTALDPDITDAFLSLLGEMDDAPSVNPMEPSIA